MSDTPSLIERHQKIGQLLALALSADHPALLDWAAVGFALQELSAAKAKLNDPQMVMVPREPTLVMLDALYFNQDIIALELGGKKAQDSMRKSYRAMLAAHEAQMVKDSKQCKFYKQTCNCGGKANVPSDCT